MSIVANLSHTHVVAAVNNLSLLHSLSLSSFLIEIEVCQRMISINVGADSFGKMRKWGEEEEEK
jgi:hypothetical protein